MTAEPTGATSATSAREPRLLDLVRSASEWVAARSRQVRVVDDGLAAFARSLPVPPERRLEHDASCHWLGHGEDTIAFFLTLDAVNFGSGWFPHLNKVAMRSGYFTLATRLTERFADHGPLSAEELTVFDAPSCAELFGQDPGDAQVAELMEHFALAWRELGHWLLERHGGRFAGPVEVAGGSAERLMEQLASLQGFADVALYAGEPVPFYKRAQIAAADIAIAFGGEGLGLWNDVHRLTIFADNLVPHVLRMSGVLSYDDALLARIERGELIAAGSEEEVEIRACAVAAVERMVAVLAADGRSATAMDLDHLLWNRGQDPAIKAHPRHRTRTTFY